MERGVNRKASGPPWFVAARRVPAPLAGPRVDGVAGANRDDRLCASQVRSAPGMSSRPAARASGDVIRVTLIEEPYLAR